MYSKKLRLGTRAPVMLAITHATRHCFGIGIRTLDTICCCCTVFWMRSNSSCVMCGTSLSFRSSKGLLIALKCALAGRHAELCSHRKVSYCPASMRTIQRVDSGARTGGEIALLHAQRAFMCGLCGFFHTWARHRCMNTCGTVQKC